MKGAIESGAKRIGREVLLPQARREEVDLLSRVDIDALQDIDQIDIGIDPLEPTGREQTVDDADLLSIYRHCRNEPSRIFSDLSLVGANVDIST